LIPLSLYIHLPWCVRKCPYCDFNSHAAGDRLQEQRYVQCLLDDLEVDLPRIWGRRILSIFIGGGTPSLFTPESLDSLLSGLRARLPITADCEITMEANPGTVEQGRFNEFRATGINRLSLGIQSFNDDKLKILGRIHNAAEAYAAVETTRRAGFDNFNLDIMFGLPGQSLAEGMADLDTALSLESTHLSWYQLTLEPNTFFHVHPPALPDDEVIDELFISGQERLADRGFEQYEVSAYAQPGRQCQHNLNYWEFGDYLGIGAGAHAKLTQPADFSIERFQRIRDPEQYMQAAPRGDAISKTQVISEPDRQFEFMLNALRLTGGFHLELFSERTGLDSALIMSRVSELADMGLISIDNELLKPTEQGRRFLNEMTERFLPDHD
jgi:oxygen-independent coproporphyrinogen-3 oxidase